jgi:hypothetical protein
MPPIDRHGKYSHCPVYCNIELPNENDCAYIRHIWRYDDGDYNSLNLELYHTNWVNILNNIPSINDVALSISNIILDTSRKYIPNKYVTIRPRDKPWMSGEIRLLIRKRDRAFKKYKNCKTEYHRAKWHFERKNVNHAIQMAKRIYMTKMTSILSNPSCKSKDFWRYTKAFMGVKTDSNIPTIIDQGVSYVTSLSKAELFADYFASQSSIDHLEIPNLPPVHTDVPFSLNSIYLSDVEVYSILKKLNTKKATGPDNISNHILKECAISLSFPLQQLFNLSFSTGQFPTCWKMSHTCPIYKASEKHIKTNYRPISLLSNISKIIEIVAFKRLYAFCKEHNILTWRNSGFKELDSTVLQCIYLTNYLYEQLDKGKEVCMVFLDVSKAFDRVWHKGLLYKLKCIGISGSLIKWFESYLSGRVQRVVIGGQESEWKPVNAGVPQGTVLGPLLFLIYVNDIVDQVSSHISLFADDTSLYRTIDSINDVTILNSDMQKLLQWGKKWLICFNANKTKYMVFSKHKVRQLDYDIVFDNVCLPREKCHRHLGIVFSDDLSWNSHIDYVISKCSKRLNIMKSIQIHVPRLCLESIYECMILPIMEYADTVYDNMSESISNKLESLQRQAALVCTGGYRHTSYDSLLKELGWNALSVRRMFHRLIIMYKIINNYTPHYMKSIITPTEQPVYNLRRHRELTVPFYRKKYCFNSFLPKTVREWNTLPAEIKSSDTLHTFKTKLKLHLYCPKNKLYRFDIGVGSIHLCRMRMGLSALNFHRFTYNFIDNPKCLNCNSSCEDVYHYMLSCPRYAAERSILLTQLAQLYPLYIQNDELVESVTMRRSFLKSIVYGESELNYEQNVCVLNHVKTYITNTKRFIR